MIIRIVLWSVIGAAVVTLITATVMGHAQRRKAESQAMVPLTPDTILEHVTFSEDMGFGAAGCPIISVERSGTLPERVVVDMGCYRSSLIGATPLPKDDVSPCHVVEVRPEGKMIDQLVVDLNCYRKDLETRL